MTLHANTQVSNRLTNRLRLVTCVAAFCLLISCVAEPPPERDLVQDQVDISSDVDVPVPDAVMDTAMDAPAELDAKPHDGVAEDTRDRDAVDHSPDAEPDVTSDCGLGSIRGRVCSASGSHWLVDLRVLAEGSDCEGKYFERETRTDEDGFYELDPLPAGTYRLEFHLETYTAHVEGIAVEPGVRMDLGAAGQCFGLDRNPEVAILTGAYDHLEVLLANQGIPYQLYEGDTSPSNPNTGYNGFELLTDLNELLTWDVLMINSGNWLTAMAQVDEAVLTESLENLRTFVKFGGTLVLTDWAAPWLELAWPSAVDFYGDDAVPGAAQVGRFARDVPAVVDSDAFRQALENAPLSHVSFTYAGWTVIEGLGLRTTEHAHAPSVPIYPAPGSLKDAPLIVSYQPEATSGQVYFMAFSTVVQSRMAMEVILGSAILDVER